MITGAIKNKVDKVWTDIWAGGITNPLTVIEQLTYLMFIRSLDEKELETEEFENMSGEKMEKIFPQSPIGQSMRWSKFKNDDPRDIYDVISQRVFPAIKNMKHGHLPDFTEQGEMIEIVDNTENDVEKDTAFARYMSDAMFLIPTPQVLQKIITGLDDLYEHDISDLDMQGDRGCKIFCVYGNETFQIRIRYVVVFVGFCSRIFCRIYLSGYSISCPLSFIHAF